MALHSFHHISTPKMVSSSKPQCSLILIFLITIINIVIAQKQSPPPSHFHIPIKKDPKTLQHYATFQIGTPPTEVNAVLDLAGTFLSLACNNHASSTRQALTCTSTTCQALTNPPKCGKKSNDTKKCVVSSTNPFSVDKQKSRFSGELNTDVVTLHATDGNAALITTRSAKASFDCVAKSGNLLTGLAGGSEGIFGLGGTTTTSLFTAYGIAPKFALCVPSSNELGYGDLFLGGGRYIFPGGVTAGEWLSVTPLSRNSARYSIAAKSIKIDKKPIRRTSMGVEISTATRYGALESSLFSAVVTEFSRRAAARNMTRVAAMKPFGACFKAKGVHWTKAGPRVPEIDIELQGNMVSSNWRINGGNSMVRVSEDVMCLGFVDGGVKAKSPVVLGSLQIEDNFLEFDLSTSRLGFSSSILPRGVSCSNFRNQ